METTASKFTTEAKLYTTAFTTLSTLIYNLSAYHLKTSGLKNNAGSADPVIKCMDTLGDQIVESSSEAAYRLAIAYGNFKYAKVYNKETPQWLAEAGNLYAINGEQRFIDIATDLKVYKLNIKYTIKNKIHLFLLSFIGISLCIVLSRRYIPFSNR